MTPAGLPHSEIRGSEGMCPSPRLIAACHVLRRLPVPRHPPCALTIFLRWFGTYIHMAALAAIAIRCDLLEKENIVFVTLCSSQGTRGGTLKTGYCALAGVEGISGSQTGTAPKSK